jgi:hypothetical protein
MATGRADRAKSSKMHVQSAGEQQERQHPVQDRFAESETEDDGAGLRPQLREESS